MEWLKEAPPAELHVSVSQVKAFLLCPKRYSYRYVFGAVPEHRSPQLILGSAVHEALGFYYTQLIVGLEPDGEGILAKYAEAFDRMILGDPPMLWAEGTTAGSVKDEGVGLVRAFLIGVNAPERATGVEQRFSADIIDPETGEVLEEQLSGFLDATVFDGGERVILEHKTAAKAWSQDQLDHNLQVGLYLAVTGADKVRLQVLCKTKVPKMLVYDLKRTEREKEEAVLIVCRVLMAIRAGAFWPNPSWACKGCEYQRRCRG